MGRELQIQQPFSLPPPPLPPLPPPSTARDYRRHRSSSSLDDAPSQPTSHFDASRKCLTFFQELLELQQKLDEPFTELNAPENSRKDVSRSRKRLKKTR